MTNDRAERADVLERIEIIRQHKLLPELDEAVFPPFKTFENGLRDHKIDYWPIPSVQMDIFRRVKDLPNPQLYLDLADWMVVAINRLAIHQWMNARKALNRADEIIEVLTKG